MKFIPTSKFCSNLYIWHLQQKVICYSRVWANQGKHRHSMENWFFPSSDVTTHEGAQIFSTKELHFWAPTWRHLTGKTRFTWSTCICQNPEIANILLPIALVLSLHRMWLQFSLTIICWCMYRFSAITNSGRAKDYPVLKDIFKYIDTLELARYYWLESP